MGRRTVDDPVLRGLLVLSAVIAGWGALGSAAHPVASWLVLGLLQACEVVLAVAVSRLPGLPPTTRRFWRLLAAAAVLFMVSSVVQLPVAVLHPAGRQVATGGTAQAGALAVGALFLVAAMLTSPLGLATARERLRFWLDAATVMVAVAIFAWHAGGVRSTAHDGGSTLATALASTLLVPAAFLVVAFGAVKLQLSGNAPITPLAGLLGGASAALEGVSTGLAGPLFESGRLPPLFALLMLSNICFIAGVRVQQIQVRADRDVLRRPSRRHYSRLPYAAIALTYGALVWELTRVHIGLGGWVALGGAVVSTVLVVVRQLTAFSDNTDLVTRLDAKVRELAEAQGVLHRALAERDRLAGELRYQAYHDSLTGLANRALFRERLDAALTATTETGGRIIVLLIDLDDFKPVNDRYGHAAGDELLRAVADRLAGCLDATDTAARLGGDEFALLLARPGAESVPALVARVTAAICRPVRLPAGAVDVAVRASVGAAVADGGHREAAALLHEADLAMYAMKRRRMPAAS